MAAHQHPETVYILVAKQPLTADPTSAFPWPDAEIVVLAADDTDAILREDVATTARISHAPRDQWRTWIEADAAGRRFEVVTNDEYCLESCAALRRTFNLPARHPTHLVAYLDKVLMKQRLNAAGVPTARYVDLDTVRPTPDPDPALASGPDLESGPESGPDLQSGPESGPDLAARYVARLGLPLVAKPRREANSRGVKVLQDFAQLQDWQRRRAGENGWHLEEFLAGDQFHANGIVRDGSIEHVQAGRYVGPLLGFDEGRRIGSATLPPDGPEAETARRLNEAVVAALGGEGAFVVHTEYIVRPDGTVAVLEVAARAPGALVSEAARLHAGINLEHANLALQAGASVAHSAPTGYHAAWLWVPIMPGERISSAPAFAGEAQVQVKLAGREGNTGASGRFGASVLLWSRSGPTLEADLQLALTWDWAR